MFKSFFLISALLAPAFAYAATPSADLSVNVVPAGHSGCLAGSFCPPGITYTNVFDEEMSKGFLSSLWKPISGDGLGCECYSDGVHGWSFPGDGTLTMNGWAAESVSPTGKHGGITFQAYPFNNPGFYEMKAIVGSDHNGWFTLAGEYTSCPQTGPGEMDFVENPAGQGHVNTYYTNSCGVTDSVALFGHDLSNVHVFGVDVSTTRGITSYLDGVEIGSLPIASIPTALCTNASVCGTALWLQAGGPGGDGIPMKVYWLRYYTEAPQ